MNHLDQLQETPLRALAILRANLHHPRRSALNSCVLLLVGTLTTWAQAVEPEAFSPTECDPTKVLGHETCTKCHESEQRQWMLTPHYRTFDALHRTPEAKEIAARLGLRSIKRNDTCLQCHYTQKSEGNRVRVISGVSCESCHGGSRDWVNLHSDYGGSTVTRESETPEHRQQRVSASIAAGMNNPANLYLIARQCLDCHTAPEERLVNVGGHTAGSPDFELVAWSQGIVRHNFVRSDGKTNEMSTPERLRVMYIVGALADLEYSLRATAKATEVAAYGQAAASRAATAKRKLWEIQQRVSDERIARALEAVSSVELTLGNSDAILAAADEIEKVAYEFAETADGSQFGAIDDLVPKPRDFKN